MIFFFPQSVCKCSEEVCLCGQKTAYEIFLMARLPDINPVSLQGVQLGHLCMQVSGVLLQDSGTHRSLLCVGVTINLLAYFYSR